MSHAVIAWGRMGIPTIGHKKLVDTVVNHAKKVGGVPMVFLSHTQDPKKNPLSYNDKIEYAQKAFGPVVKKTDHKTIIDAMKSLQADGHKEVTLVAGQDRVPEFEKLLHKYNGKEYNFDRINVHSAGDRDPDSEGVEGMSASKMREHAANNNIDQFKGGLAPGVRNQASEIMQKVRAGMKLEHLEVIYNNALEQAVLYECDNSEELNYMVDLFYQQNFEIYEAQKVKDNPDLPGHQPAKYYTGMSKLEQLKREKHFKKASKMSSKDPDAYQPAPGDQQKSTTPSKYTTQFKQMYGEELELYEIAGLRNKSKKSGISYSTLKKVYDRGMAAWRTGHRPGTTPQQWAMARVNSYITKGKTYHTADKDLREEQIDEFAPAIVAAPVVAAGARAAAQGIARAMARNAARRAVSRSTGRAGRIASGAAGVAAALAAGTNTQQDRSATGQTQTGTLVKPSVIRGRKPSERPLTHSGIVNRELAELATSEQTELDNPNNRLEGTTAVRKLFQRMTPGQENVEFDLGQDTVVPQDDKTNLRRRNAIKRFKHYVDEQNCNCDCTESLVEEEALFEEKKVTLNKPFRTPGGPKKFSVYVKNDKGNVVKVNFGDPNLSIKRDQPNRRKSFRARHNCDNPGPKWKARYWSCRMWAAKPVSNIV